MKKLILTSVLLATLTFEVLAEMNAIEMSRWESLAEHCGMVEQLFEAINEPVHLAESKFLRHAQNNGADDHQLQILRFSWFEGQRRVMEQGLVEGSYPIGDLTEVKPDFEKYCLGK